MLALTGLTVRPGTAASACPAPDPGVGVQVLRVQDFGLVGDGVTNDYPGLKQLSQQLTGQAGGKFRVVFEAGKNYYLDHAYADPTQWAAHDLVFNGLDYIELDLNGSTVTTTRNLLLPPAPGQTYSSTTGVTFVLAHNQLVVIKNGTVDGSNSSATLISGATYVHARSSAFMIGGNTEVHLTDLTVHNAICDNVLLRYEDSGTGTSIANKTVCLTNCTFLDAGRNCASLTGNADLTADGCRFEQAGVTFSGSAPYAGIDIEDEWFWGPSDVTSYHYRFSNCDFVGNRGGDVYSATRMTNNDLSTAVVDRDIQFSACRFDYTTRGTRLIGDCGVTFAQCTMTNVTLAPFYGVSTTTYPAVDRGRWTVEILGAAWTNTLPDRRLMMLPSNAAPVLLIHDNELSHTAQSPANYWFAWLQLNPPTTTGWRESIVSDNVITVADTCAGSNQLVVRGQYATFRGNSWRSTLPAGSLKLSMAGATITDTLDPAFQVV
ncbi:right-handed parallel beta-helix repeat-containing protein [Kribbella sp. NPDC050459]|uniref:right-handed parallel beta-helix repeat-containing protein n=1 Tax=Kribbella sp. NPDC050459 TaxID=3155785 RepID=UPI0033FB7B2B